MMFIKLQKTTKYITVSWSFPKNISNRAPNRPCRRVFILVILSSFSTLPSRPAAIEPELECNWSMVIWQHKTQALVWICGWCLRFLQSCTSDPYEEATENSPSESQPGRFDESFLLEADIWRWKMDLITSQALETGKTLQPLHYRPSPSEEKVCGGNQILN
jgi:hypothetical protein